MKLLLEVGARPGIKDQDERTALHIAAQYVDQQLYVVYSKL